MVKEIEQKDFRETEIGSIPWDWDLVTLGQIGNFKNGINKGKEDFGHGDPFVNLLDVFGKNIIDKSAELGLVNSSETEKQLYSLKRGDVIFVRSSVKPSGVGLTILCKDDLPNTVFSGFLIRFRDNGKISDDYKIHCFYEEGFRKRLISSSTISANTNINQVALRELLIPFPPTKAEQTAIATALNDADRLVRGLEKLIAKKRAIKQGAMQELLKPKKGWEETTIGDIANVVGGGTPSTFNSNYWHGDINWFTPTEIGDKTYSYQSARKITQEGLDSCSAKLLPIGTILLTSRASIGDVSILMVEGCTNQGFQSLIAKEGNSNKFLYYLILTLKHLLLQNASGSTFLEISPGKLKSIAIKVPNYDIQNHIAQILSDMDNEIQELETKLAKYNMLKQGMMQNLLTGKIRLINTQK